MPEETAVYTDGACLGNPGPGGWGWVVPEGPFRSGACPDATNQRMELAAALEALREVSRPTLVISDSTYLVNCFRDGWWEGWLRRGWRNANRRSVANRDLWEPLVGLYRDGGVRFRWVKGHGGDRWNEVADWLAFRAAADGRGMAGEQWPPPQFRRPPAGDPF